MTDAEQVKALLNDHDCLRSELDQIRRILLPHPDAKYGEDPGCGCDMLEAVDAAELVAAEIKRLRVELDTVADVWRVREMLVERDRLRAELQEVRDITGVVRHTSHDDCRRCGCVKAVGGGSGGGTAGVVRRTAGRVGAAPATEPATGRTLGRVLAGARPGSGTQGVRRRGHLERRHLNAAEKGRVCGCQTQGGAR